ncbi:hypothetical protein MHYP_G00211350 [Metynnis hypsauchen]
MKGSTLKDLLDCCNRNPLHKYLLTAAVTKAFSSLFFIIEHILLPFVLKVTDQTLFNYAAQDIRVEFGASSIQIILHVFGSGLRATEIAKGFPQMSCIMNNKEIKRSKDLMLKDETDEFYRHCAQHISQHIPLALILSWNFSRATQAIDTDVP